MPGTRWSAARAALLLNCRASSGRRGHAGAAERAVVAGVGPPPRRRADLRRLSLTGLTGTRGSSGSSASSGSPTGTETGTLTGTATSLPPSTVSRPPSGPRPGSARSRRPPAPRPGRRRATTAASPAVRSRRRCPTSARSPGEFIRIRTRLSHWDKTCGWIFDGRCVESSSPACTGVLYMIWTRRATSAASMAPRGRRGMLWASSMTIASACGSRAAARAARRGRGSPQAARAGRGSRSGRER